MRITGLATGMDTESIIRDMMKVQRIPLNKITQQKQYLEWQLDDYRSINRNLKSMSDNVFDTVMRQGTYLAKTVNISNPNAVNIRSTTATSEFSGSISVSQLATQANWQSSGTEETKNLDVNSEISNLFGAGVTSITITAPGSEEKTVNFAPEDTIKSVLDKINKGTGVSAFYDAPSGKIAMTANNSGDGFIKVTGFGDDAANVAAENDPAQRGQNAVFTFNGLTTERSSNTFEINGFEVTLKEVTTNPVTFSSAPDVDKVFDSVKKFVDDYNKMIEELNAKIREPKHRDYKPLSAEEKADMKEKEIELWEEKAMSGTLRNDPIIQSMLTKMRSALNGTVEGSDGPIRLSDFGITTSKEWRDHGKLVIDEDKLRQAISDDPNKVYEALGKTTGTDDEKGLISRFRSALDEGHAAIRNRAGSVGVGIDTFTLGRTLREMDKQVIRFEDRLKMVEDRMWKQFTAMEMAIQRANNQAAQLMNALGGGAM